MSRRRRVGSGRRGRRRPGRARWLPLVVAVAIAVLWAGWVLVPEDAPGTLAVEVADRVEGAVAGVVDGPDTALPTSTVLAGEPLPTPVAGEPATRGQDRGALAGPGDGPLPGAEPTRSPGSGSGLGEASPAPTGPLASGEPASGDPSTGPGLPPGAGVAVPQVGDGVFVVARGGSSRVGEGTLVRYTVEVESPLAFDPAATADVVDAILADPRSWTGRGEWALERVSDVEVADARLMIASPDTTDRLCAPLETRGRYSCRNGDLVVLNGVRWSQGAETWEGDLVGYREYLVNHELGHRLGRGHVPCPASGEPAPVMLQQTKTLDGCEPNGWPYP